MRLKSLKVIPNLNIVFSILTFFLVIYSEFSFSVQACNSDKINDKVHECLPTHSLAKSHEIANQNFITTALYICYIYSMWSELLLSYKDIRGFCSQTCWHYVLLLLRKTFFLNFNKFSSTLPIIWYMYLKVSF